MKKLLFILLIVSRFTASAQLPSIPGFTNLNQKNQWVAGAFNKTVYIPAGTTPTFNGSPVFSGALYVDSVNQRLHFYAGGAWRKLSATDSVYARSDSLFSLKNSVEYYIGISNGGGRTVLGGIGIIIDSTTYEDSVIVIADTAHIGTMIRGAFAIRITNENFSSATEYDDPRIIDKPISVFVNEIGRFLDSATEFHGTATGIEIDMPGFDAVSNTYHILIIYTVAGISGIGLPIDLTYPGDMAGILSFKVRRRPNSTFFTNYDWTAVKNSISGDTLWVNPQGGLDTNPGTFASPKKSIAWCLQFSGAKVIMLYPGWYNYEESFNGVDINRDMKFISTGIAYVTTSDTTGAWSGVVGNPGAYESTYSGPAALESPLAADFSNKDEYGVPRRLTPVTSIALVASTANSVFAVNGTNKFYVHTFDGRVPDDSIKVFFEKNTVESFLAHNIYFENIRFMGGGSSGRALLHFDNPNDLIQRKVVMKNCWVWGALFDGTANLRNMFGAYKDCKFSYNGQDGNDFDDYNNIGLEEDCVGYHNGFDNSDANNGSTAHDKVKIVRVNCVYKYNQGRNTHDIEEASAFNVNILTDSSRATVAANYGYGISSPGSANTTVYCLDCISEDPKGWDIRTTEGHGFFFNTNKASTTNNMVGTVVDLSGYQFDAVPVVLTATVIAPTTIRILFSEPVTATTAGWSFSVNGTPQTPSAVSGSGTNTLDFTVTTIGGSDIVTRGYNSSTGNTIDSNSGELISFSAIQVTIGI